MGIERHVRLADETLASWPAIRSQLSRAGESPVLRMIDGELSLPDDEPPLMWQELRISLTGGMVTLRRSQIGIACVIWGNAEPALERTWNIAAWAVANSAGGLIVFDREDITADEFAVRLKLFVE